jgi:hypothetical protein
MWTLILEFKSSVSVAKLGGAYSHQFGTAREPELDFVFS